ncbi:hypothetical protein HU200_012995 [Digitaria exilis]|uniref:F-box associated beta-propeller type 3 domain-containing protein n=1 Tax=Digitaria exilis TaxID=1010633 RepID=A0A835KP81_9POAL|nr:hypothetical protein HU200_012995 [Digitaria exilis]
MARKKAGEDEVAAAPGPTEPSSAATKRRRTTGAAGTASSGLCDDVLRSIFARVPTRTAVASMALSKHHRLLMRSPDFIDLHRRLSPPLPLPHVAYLAAAAVKRSHTTRGGTTASTSNAPMHTLVGTMYLGMRYVNTCNGVVLLAGEHRTTCVLWNPAIAGDEKELTGREILGLGYGPRSKAYKLLLTRQEERRKELLVYALGGAGEERPQLRSLLSEGLDGAISNESLYMDGTIYLLHLDKRVILAIDVDDETVTAIDLLGTIKIPTMFTLLVMSGRPCVDVQDDRGRALWLLTAEHQWEMRCIIKGHRQHAGDILSFGKYIRDYNSQHDICTPAGVWDCGGVLVMYLRAIGENHKLFLYCAATKNLIEVDLPASLRTERSDYAFCWGYKPTLVSPGSVVGEPKQDEERRRDRAADIMAALKPINVRDRRVGQKATLDTVCFMELLLRIMGKLPDNLQDVMYPLILRLSTASLMIFSMGLICSPSAMSFFDPTSALTSPGWAGT